DAIYCRYFDQQRRELARACETVVFHEFTAQCLRRRAKYISLSEKHTGPHEFPVPIVDRTNQDEYNRILVDEYVRSGDAEVIVLHDRFIRDKKLWQLTEMHVTALRFLKLVS
ncbi:hypothetical protein KIN20_005718, partial [Parelaphostrongylus tenuis]